MMHAKASTKIKMKHSPPFYKGKEENNTHTQDKQTNKQTSLAQHETNHKHKRGEQDEQQEVYYNNNKVTKSVRMPF